MMNRIFVMLALMLALAVPVFGQQQATLDSALQALGGADAIADLSSFSIEATAARATLHEGFSVSATPELDINLASTVNYDVANDSLRIDYSREAPFGRAEYSEIIAGDLGYIVASDSRFGGEGHDMTSDRWASTRKQQWLLNPHLLLQAVIADSSLVSDGGTAALDGQDHNLLVVEDDVAPVTLFVDAETGLISRLETIENDPLLRDAPLAATYTDWAAAGDVLFPNEVAIEFSGVTIHSETRDSVTVNGALDAGLFAFPEAAAPTFDADLAARGAATSQTLQMFSALGFPQDGPSQTFVDASEIAPGVYLVAGGSHNSLAIEQANGVVIAEAPLNPERSEAVIAWVESEFPDKPITHVISSHHHRDHSSGLRSYVAAGATVVLGEAGQALFEQVFAAPSTIIPDELAATDAEAVIEAVAAGGSLEIADDERPVMALAFENPHTEDMVLTYVPESGVVFVVDIFNPGFGPIPPELVTNIEALGIEVAILAGGHGGAAPVE